MHQARARSTTNPPSTGDAGGAEKGCWVDLTEAAVGELDQLTERFGLHELAVEDAQHAHQRPKLERYGDTLVVVAKPALYDDDAETITIGELFIAVGTGFVVTVRHGIARDLGQSESGPTEQSLDDERPLDVLYRLLDRVVDAYQPIVTGLQVDIRQIEAEVFSVERTNAAPRIYALKREVLDMLRNVEPLVGPLDELATLGGATDSSGESLHEYFRDIADHTRRLVAQLRTINDVLSDALQANLAQVSVSQNDDMRTMSAWAAIFLVPTLLAGIWGMNFESMPELEWRFGYPLAVAAMALTSFVLWWQFRRSGWLGSTDRHDRDRPSR